MVTTTQERRGRPSSRAKILEAAEALAKEVGPNHLSLEAVAERAGVSKGGLLYNFPNKAALLRALVEHHLAATEMNAEATALRYAGSRNPVARAHIEAFREKCSEKLLPSPSGVLAAIAENPGFIEPIRRYNHKLIEKIRRSSDDPYLALITFLAIEGMRSLQLFECDPLNDSERRAVLKRLSELLETQEEDVEHAREDTSPRLPV